MIPSVYHSRVIIIHSNSVVREKVCYVIFLDFWNKSAGGRDETTENTGPGTLVAKCIQFHCVVQKE